MTGEEALMFIKGYLAERLTRTGKDEYHEGMDEGIKNVVKALEEQIKREKENGQEK